MRDKEGRMYCDRCENDIDIVRGSHYCGACMTAMDEAFTSAEIERDKLAAENKGLLAAMGFQQGDIEACAERLIRIRIIEAYKPLIKERDALAEERDTLVAQVEKLEAALADMTASAEYWRTCGGRGKRPAPGGAVEWAEAEEGGDE